MGQPAGPSASLKGVVHENSAITLRPALVTVLVTTTAQAFCGFYVARADTSLFNQASQVVLVRDDDRTVITMANDFEGDVRGFRRGDPGSHEDRTRADQCRGSRRDRSTWTPTQRRDSSNTTIPTLACATTDSR